jgi:hypothetical protein
LPLITSITSNRASAYSKGGAVSQASFIIQSSSDSTKQATSSIRAYEGIDEDEDLPAAKLGVTKTNI